MDNNDEYIIFSILNHFKESINEVYIIIKIR